MAAADKLELVAVDTLPDPPYPATVRSGGWRFDLDLDRVEQSTTWSRAPAELRPWLLMLWTRSWRQIPCGSLPSDDTDIAALIGMPEAQFQVHRNILLRGWWLAKDGRYYHRVLTDFVLVMHGRRLRDSERRKLPHKPLKQKKSHGIHGSPRESIGTITSTNTETVPTEERLSSVGVKGTDRVVLERGAGKTFSLTAAQPAPTPEKAQEKKPKATRLPETWTLPDEWKTWAVTVHKLEPQRVVRIALKFKDHWLTTPGAKGCKLRWDSTWRNWIRKECGE